MTGFFSSLYSFNLFKHPVELYFRNHQKQGHWSGVLGSYIFTIFFLVVSLFFGLDFYTRTNPSINLVEASLGDYNEIKANVKDFPVFVYSLDENFHHRVAAYFFENGNYQKVSRQCTEKELASFDFQKQKFSRYYCIDIHKIEMDNTQLSSFYFIDCASLYLLGLDKEEWGFKNCPVLTDKQKEFLNTYYMYYYSPKVKLEMDNYDNPISTYYESHSQALKVKELRAMKIKMTFIRVKDDKGWILKDESSTWGVRFDTNLETIMDFVYDSFYSRNQIDISNIVETHNRIYTKLQNLAAEIGGFLKVCMVFIRLPLIFVSNENVKVRCIQDFLSSEESNSFKRNSLRSDLNQSGKENDQSGNNLVNKIPFNKPSEPYKKASNNQSGTRRFNTFQAKQVKKHMLYKMICGNLCTSKSNKKSTDDKIFLTAERLTKDILSIEHIFRSYFEMDIIRRVLIGEEDSKLLKSIRNPNIFKSEDALTARYIKYGSPVNEKETEVLKQKLKAKIQANEQLTGFEQVIIDYL